jgi:TPR repeat protein
MILAASAAHAGDATALDKSCAAGKHEDCVKLGRMYRAGEGIPADMAEAERSFRRVVVDFASSCARAEASGCLLLGDLYRDGALGLSVDGARALHLYDRACVEGKDSGSCQMLAQLLTKGDPKCGIAIDYQRAAKYRALALRNK